MIARLQASLAVLVLFGCTGDEHSLGDLPSDTGAAESSEATSDASTSTASGTAEGTTAVATDATSATGTTSGTGETGATLVTGTAGECTRGETMCQDAYNLMTCTYGSWTVQACVDLCQAQQCGVGPCGYSQQLQQDDCLCQC